MIATRTLTQSSDTATIIRNAVEAYKRGDPTVKGLLRAHFQVLINREMNDAENFEHFFKKQGIILCKNDQKCSQNLFESLTEALVCAVLHEECTCWRLSIGGKYMNTVDGVVRVMKKLESHGLLLVYSDMPELTMLSLQRKAA